MGGRPNRNPKDRPIMIPKGGKKSGEGPSGRPEYKQLSKCPHLFKVNLPLSNLTRQLKNGELVSLSIVNEKEIKIIIGTFQIGSLMEKQAKKISDCLKLGVRYRGTFHRRMTKGRLSLYAEFNRIN